MSFDGAIIRALDSESFVPRETERVENGEV